MINILINFIIFIIVAFIYIHINYQLSTNNDLEIYDIENIEDITNNKLQEICNIKQPFIFNLNNELLDKININALVNNYKGFDINIRKIQEYNLNNNILFPLTLKEALKLFENDISNNYISEYNEEFINETSIKKLLSKNDILFRPPMCFQCIYDILLGSVNNHTPLRYQLNGRNYYMVINGEIEIMLTIPKNKKYLNIIKDYNNFEFRSCNNPFDIKDYDIEKVKYLSLKLVRGNVIYIPFGWIYSIKFKEKDTIVASFKYKMFMNVLAILPELCYKYLQNDNIKYIFLEKKNNKDIQDNKDAVDNKDVVDNKHVVDNNDVVDNKDIVDNNK